MFVIVNDQLNIYSHRAGERVVIFNLSVTPRPARIAIPIIGNKVIGNCKHDFWVVIECTHESIFGTGYIGGDRAAHG
ncbi:hypothetical protein DF044_27090 [Burkholderia contaminans]|uniref:Uncharacterized protein n=1 Tax=Burkholderia contaminans TaxID=488447 RepID=A0A3N8R1Y4_9BURK|nr:hypothetical protein DF044_27090 [Burkholderia contaminans]RQT29942.1 hypothetical protein DF037_12660 [Burkholderia contaminans]